MVHIARIRSLRGVMHPRARAAVRRQPFLARGQSAQHRHPEPPWLAAGRRHARGVASGVAPFIWTSRASAASGPAQGRSSWPGTPVPCLAPVAAALKENIFRNHGLDVELINFWRLDRPVARSHCYQEGGCRVGMALRWLCRSNKASTSS
ncbi:hypothetical protein ACU4GD_37500 [Cupriavidus basilensis]